MPPKRSRPQDTRDVMQGLFGGESAFSADGGPSQVSRATPGAVLPTAPSPPIRQGEASRSGARVRASAAASAGLGVGAGAGAGAGGGGGTRGSSAGAGHSSGMPWGTPASPSGGSFADHGASVAKRQRLAASEDVWEDDSQANEHSGGFDAHAGGNAMRAIPPSLGDDEFVEASQDMMTDEDDL